MYEEHDDYVLVTSNRGNPDTMYVISLNGEIFMVRSNQRRVAINRSMRAYEDINDTDVPSEITIQTEQVETETPGTPQGAAPD